jgi:hypothetical protein
VKLIPLVLLASFALTSARGQTTPNPTPSAGANPDTTADLIQLPAGTPLVLRSKSELWSNKNHAGEQVEFEVAKAITSGGLVLIARGTVVKATVIVADPARRKGKGGQLDLIVQGVPLVTGQLVNVRGSSTQQGGGQRDMVGNMISSGLLTAGLASPLFLLQKGHEVEIRRGERVPAFLSSDVAVPRDEVAAHQPPPPPPPRSDVFSLYLIKESLKGDIIAVGGHELTWMTVVGEQGYGLSTSCALRVELPPGKYYLRGPNGTSQMLIRTKPQFVVPLEAKAGETYYYQILFKDKLGYTLEAMTAEAAALMIPELEVEIDIPIEKATPKQLENVRAQYSGK